MASGRAKHKSYACSHCGTIYTSDRVGQSCETCTRGTITETAKAHAMGGKPRALAGTDGDEL